MSDRILVMSEGRAMAVLNREEATQEIIMAYASGETENDILKETPRGEEA
jgi:hypothetical protein